ncbi:hypothetical protein NDU88_003180 [Pleurodeles waltl]|uniref:Asp23/Gls24 family envelope stress response protein n=1 Tax=Pleurodeles waltl TaxID=8319 RepID=A0AAV7T5R6_PLEWA|nr:hypothetical protein NDU88_003180 [Pleurodeles waltl]
MHWLAITGHATAEAAWARARQEGLPYSEEQGSRRAGVEGGAMGRGGSRAGPPEQWLTISLVSPGTQSQGLALALTIHDDKLENILEAIEATGQDLRNRVDAVVVEVSLLHEDHKKVLKNDKHGE